MAQAATHKIIPVDPGISDISPFQHYFLNNNSNYKLQHRHYKTEQKHWVTIYAKFRLFCLKIRCITVCDIIGNYCYF